jgi:hypothetical protein
MTLDFHSIERNAQDCEIWQQKNFIRPTYENF